MGEIILKLGASGAWDDGAICCVSAVRHDGRVLLWYAGQRQNDAVWRIGLATSEDGVHFERLGDTPLVNEGGRDDFDGRGVRDPEVVCRARGDGQDLGHGRNRLSTVDHHAPREDRADRRE